MNDAVGTRGNVISINRAEDKGIIVEVLEYQKLLAPKDAMQGERLWFMTQQNLKVRQLAIHISNSKIQLQAGALSYMQGNIEMVSGVTVGNALGRVFSGGVTGEAAAKPEYTGTGLIVTEPSFRHFIPIQLNNGQSVIVDKGMFYMASGSMKVSPVAQDTVSAALLGKEGIFQLKIDGPGLAILESKVPMDEINKISLVQDTLKVDGNFAVLRSGDIKFTVERSAKTLVGSAVSGEGLLNVYRGTGTVWLAPTIPAYDMI